MKKLFQMEKMQRLWTVVSLKNRSELIFAEGSIRCLLEELVLGACKSACNTANLTKIEKEFRIQDTLTKLNRQDPSPYKVSRTVRPKEYFESILGGTFRHPMAWKVAMEISSRNEIDWQKATFYMGLKYFPDVTHHDRSRNMNVGWYGQRVVHLLHNDNVQNIDSYSKILSGEVKGGLEISGIMTKANVEKHLTLSETLPWMKEVNKFKYFDTHDNQCEIFRPIFDYL